MEYCYQRNNCASNEQTKAIIACDIHLLSAQYLMIRFHYYFIREEIVQMNGANGERNRA